MNTIFKSFIIVSLCLFISMPFHGCGDKDNQSSGQKIESLEKEVETLTALLNDANQKIEALGTNDRVTRNDCDEIREWADSMVKSYGQGLWYPGESIYPVFVKTLKSVGIEKLIEELNARFRADRLPEVLYLGTEKDKVLVGVSDDQQLTGAMGSDGALSYMNAVTFTLGSIPGVSKVEFKFEEGDHAVPGTYSRSFIKK